MPTTAQQQLKKLYQNNRHVGAIDFAAATETYETVKQFQNVMKAHVDSGIYRLDVCCRSDRSEFSPDCHYLFTLERVTHTLRVWDLLHPRLAQVEVWKDIVDAAFEPAGLLFTLEVDGLIRGRTIHGSQVVAIRYVYADSLSVSKDYVLAFSTTTVTRTSQLSSCSVRLWGWTRDGVVRDIDTIQDAATACVSTDGEFVVHSRRGVIQTSPVDPARSRYRQLLHDAGTDEMGDVIGHAVSPDNLVVAAIYVCGIKFWWTKEFETSRYFNLSETFHDTFGHAAFSPDNRHVALGSWEGNIVIMERRRHSFEVSKRFTAGSTVPHLSWSRDGSYLAVSSYSGAAIIDPQQRKRVA